MSQHYRIFSIERRAYWTQDQYGYTDDEKEAGFWTADEIERLGLDDQQHLVPCQPSALALKLREVSQ